MCPHPFGYVYVCVPLQGWMNSATTQFCVKHRLEWPNPVGILAHSGTMCPALYLVVHVPIRLASFPGRFKTHGETAWYRLFAHAQEFRLFYGYLAVNFMNDDGPKSMLMTWPSTASTQSSFVTSLSIQR